MTGTVTRPVVPPSTRGSARSQEARAPRAPHQVLSKTALTLYGAIAIGPLLLVLVNSLRPTRSIVASPLGLPEAEGLRNFVTAWDRANFSTYFFNSVLVTVGALLLGVGTATLASYALGRIRFPGNGAVQTFFLAGLLLPAQLGIVPIFYLLQGMGMIDSVLGLILVYSAQALPLSIFLLTMFFRGLPAELEEAARLDGAGELRIFFRVMLPLVRPAVVTVVVVQAAPIWNDFFYPLVLLRSQDNFTLPVGLTAFFGQFQSDLGALFAGLVIVSLPLIVLFAIGIRQVVSGLTAGIGK